MTVYVEAQITGKVISQEALDYPVITEFANAAKLQLQCDEGLLVFELFEDDTNPQATKIVTTDGEFFITAQNNDGHGWLVIVKEQAFPEIPELKSDIIKKHCEENDIPCVDLEQRGGKRSNW